MERFRLALFDWQTSPEDARIAQKINLQIREIALSGRGLTIRIKDEVLKRQETSRMFLSEDLKNYFKHEGNFLTCRFIPKKGRVGEIYVGVIDLWPAKKTDRGIIDKYNFVIAKRENGGLRMIANFRPHEIDSLSPAM